MQTKNLISLQVVLNFITCMKSTLLPDPVALQGASPNGESWIDAKCCENFFFLNLRGKRFTSLCPIDTLHSYSHSKFNVRQLREL